MRKVTGFEKVLMFVKSHRILFTFIMLIVATGTIFAPEYFFKLPWINKEEITGLELVVSCSQIVSALFVIAGTVIAVWQYCLSSSQRISEFEFSRVEKAVELSNYYKDNILNRYSFVKGVFDRCNITSMLETKRKSCELKDFDIIELKEIFTPEEIDKFAKLPQDEEFIKTIIESSSAYNFDLNGYTKSVKESSEDGKPVMEFSVNGKEVFNDFFKTYIVQTLNNAEYFAMSFTHNIADESVIYQSIHPTFLEMCFVMYYFIAKNSDPASSKLYTNLAELYCLWRTRQQKQKDAQKKKSREGCKEVGTIVGFEK